MSNKEKKKDSISGRLVFIRGNTGKSQKVFAELMGVSRGIISKCETGAQTPSLEVLRKYKQMCNIPYDFLIDGDCIEETDLYKRKIIQLISRLTNGEKQFVLRMLEQFIESKELLKK